MPRGIFPLLNGINESAALASGESADSFKLELSK